MVVLGGVCMEISASFCAGTGAFGNILVFGCRVCIFVIEFNILLVKCGYEMFIVL